MTKPSIGKNPSSGGQRTATNLALGVEMACRQPKTAEKNAKKKAISVHK
jgi:hypothetical protein